MATHKDTLSNISTAALFDEVLNRLNYDGDDIDAITVGEMKRAAVQLDSEGPSRKNYREALINVRDTVESVNSMMLSPNPNVTQCAYVIGMSLCAITYVLAENDIAVDFNSNRKRS